MNGGMIDQVAFCFLKSILTTDYGIEPILAAKASAQQINGSDCGVHTCENIRLIMTSPDEPKLEF